MSKTFRLWTCREYLALSTQLNFLLSDQDISVAHRLLAFLRFFCVSLVVTHGTLHFMRTLVSKRKMHPSLQKIVSSSMRKFPLALDASSLLGVVKTTSTECEHQTAMHLRRKPALLVIYITWLRTLWHWSFIQLTWLLQSATYLPSTWRIPRKSDIATNILWHKGQMLFENNQKILTVTIALLLVCC